MRVNQSTSSPVQNQDKSAATTNAGKTARAEKADKKTAASSAAPKAPIADTVKPEISSRAKDMAQIKTAAAEAPETREEKIAALKARIAASKYNVDNEAIADRMVDDHLRMSGIG